MYKSFIRKIDRFVRREQGVTLIEVAVSIVVLAVILMSVPAVLLLIANSQFSWSEQRIAESLGRNQVEYIKVASYMAGNETNPLPSYAEVPVPNSSYEIEVVAQPINQVTKQPLSSGEDQGLQEVTVSIYHVDRLILETRNYKVDRLEVLAL